MSKRGDSRVASQVRLDPAIDPVSISRISIVMGEDQVTLAKENTEWFVMEATESSTLAKEADVDTLLKVLDGVDVELVSQSQERQADLGLSDESAYRIEYGTSDEVKYTLLLSSNDQRLVRQKDRENVYRWSSEYSRLVRTDVEDWLAPSPTPVDSEVSEGE